MGDRYYLKRRLGAALCDEQIVISDRNISYSRLASTHSFSLLSSSLGVSSVGIQPFE